MNIKKSKKIKIGDEEIKYASKSYFEWAIKSGRINQFNLSSKDIIETFIQAATWMRDNYLEKNG